MFGYDPESPIQDADIEMMELHNAANRENRLKKKGICCHGWRQGLGNGMQKCNECGRVATETELDEERKKYLLHG